MKILFVLSLAAAAGTWGVMQPDAEDAASRTAMSQAATPTCSGCQVVAINYPVSRFPLSDYR